MPQESQRITITLKPAYSARLAEYAKNSGLNVATAAASLIALSLPLPPAKTAINHKAGKTTPAMRAA